MPIIGNEDRRGKIMSRATLIRNLLTLVGAGIATACTADGDEHPSDGGAGAIGGDGEAGEIPLPTTTVRDPAADRVTAANPNEPDAGAPTGSATYDKALYISRAAVPSGGASGMVYDSGSGTVSTLPTEFAFRVNSMFRTHSPSRTSIGRACELATSGGEEVDFNSYVRCLEETDEGSLAAVWDDRGDNTPEDGLAAGSIVGGKMVLGRNAGIKDMAVRSFDDGDWGYFPLYGLGEVLGMNLASAGEETYIPVRDYGCMGPTAAVEAGGAIFTLAEAADGTGRVCVIDPAFDEIDQDGEIALTTSYPKMGVAVENKILVVARGVELFNTDTRVSEGVLWDSAALCAGIEEEVGGACSVGHPLHISVSEGLRMGAVTFMAPTNDIEVTNYYVRTFTWDEAGLFTLGGVIFATSQSPGSPGGVEGTAFVNDSDIMITHRLGLHKYNIESGEVMGVAAVGADGRFPTQAPVLLSASGDEE